jgi:tRNA modification GTPase
VLFRSAPHSFTGEAVVELQGHGGPVVLAAVLSELIGRGARLARPGEFSERAFLNGQVDLLQAETIADVIDAASVEAVRAAQQTLDGVFSRRLTEATQALTEARVFVEGALDFSDEDIPWLADAGLAERLQGLQRLLEETLREAAQGRRLREGLTVAIVGAPNAGKSTLLNALAGTEAAIVSEQAGTTRDVLREHLLIDGLPITVVDTAGLRETEDAIEREGIRRAHAAMAQAELALFLVDDRHGVTAADQALLSTLPAALPVLVLRNKCDLAGHEPMQLESEPQPTLRLSGKTGAGLPLLRHALREQAGLGQGSEGVFLARARHLEALQEALQHLVAARRQLAASAAAELAAEELRLAQTALGRITGEVTSDALLGEIFARFCIGK